MADPGMGAVTGKHLMAQVVAGFQLASLRCAAEARMRARIEGQPELRRRLGEWLAGEERATRRKLALLTEAYRVDGAITPRLHKLGFVLKQGLRLPADVELFVRGSAERAARCVPSRSGSRLILLLDSGLVELLSAHELLFVLGAEIGRALLGHRPMSRVPLGDPGLSPLDAARLRGLERRQDVSSDRIGLLACQDTRVAAAALFKMAAGLSDRWAAFDESAYAQHFEAAVVPEAAWGLEVAGTHPTVPFRLRALSVFARSEPYARAVGAASWDLSTDGLEAEVERLLGLLEPDLSGLEGVAEEEAANRFLVDGALLLVAADGVVEPSEVEWLQTHLEGVEVGPELVRRITDPDFRRHALAGLGAKAYVLRNKLSENQRAGLLRLLCDLALHAGGMPQPELELLEEFRRLLDVSGELARTALRSAATESPPESPA
ncbi:MAG: hypothetical protein HYZ53_10155 [Planctomycetes bacterium]|nr:hypothetical protein [Planctomycetota bacterium]